MQKEDKQQAIELIKNVSDNEIAKDPYYYDGFGLACFNGIIALQYIDISDPKDDYEIEEKISDKLYELYGRTRTRYGINRVHEAYCNHRISFAKAKELCVKLLERFE